MREERVNSVLGKRKFEGARLFDNLHGRGETKAIQYLGATIDLQ